MSLNNKDFKICIFINSCDQTHDIAIYFLKSFKKFIKNDLLKVFIGINKKKHDEKKYNFLNYISAPKSNWQEETIIQLNKLKNEYGYTNIIHILDDFIFNDYSDIKDLKLIIDFFNLQNIQYLCLKKMDECFIVNILNNFKSKNTINKVRESYPYYTSLQITLWDIGYLIKNIKNCKSIWGFERQQLQKNHYYLTKNFFHYKHVVEKGEWNYGTSNYIEKHIGKFSHGDRPLRKSFFGSKLFFFKKITFFLFGFLLMRIRGN